MSQENVDVVRRGYAHFVATGDLDPEVVAPDLLWDMSNFRGWPEQQTYEGIEGARTFLRDWGEAWEDWEVEVDAFHDAGDKVVAIVHQRGRSKGTGLQVEMHFGQVWTVRDGRQTHMEMYAEPAEALEAAGLG